MRVSLIKWLVFLITVGSIALGGFLGAFPERAIRMQIAFYRWINWKMEPISWELEVRNTRLMGVLVIAIAAAALCFRFR